MKYIKHIFICTNLRANEKKSCGDVHGLALVAAFKKLIKEKKLNVEIRAQKAGCLDVCDFGPALVIYPEGVFYGNVQVEDVAEIVESHLCNNKIVERLQITFEPRKFN